MSSEKKNHKGLGGQGLGSSGNLCDPKVFNPVHISQLMLITRCKMRDSIFSIWKASTKYTACPCGF